MKRIIAAAMVKNESDIIESFIRHAFTYADGMVIYDDNSFDDTPDIIRSLAGEGFNLRILSGDMALGLFEQAPVTNRLINEAIDEMGADIILPLDADEFLIITPGYEGLGIRDVLESLPYSGSEFFASCWTHFIPTEFVMQNGVFLPRHCQKYYEYKPIQLRLYSNKVIFGPEIIRETGGYVVKGNHNITTDKLKTDAGLVLTKTMIPQLTLAHIPYRSREQLMIKVLTGYANRIATLTGEEAADGYKRDATAGYGTIYQALKKQGYITETQIRALIFTTYINTDNTEEYGNISDLIRDYAWDAFDIPLRYTDYIKFKDSMWGIILSFYENIITDLNMRIRELKQK